MTDCKEIVRRLRRIAIDKFRCFGCGYEHNCGIHGCAVVRDAVTTIETLTAELSDLQHRYEKMSD